MNEVIPPLQGLRTDRGSPQHPDGKREEKKTGPIRERKKTTGEKLR